MSWHCAQLVVVLCAYLWMFVTVGDAEKSVVVWQDVQAVPDTYGMWFAGFTCPVHASKFVPWHDSQSAPPGSPAFGCSASRIV